MFGELSISTQPGLKIAGAVSSRAACFPTTAAPPPSATIVEGKSARGRDESEQRACWEVGIASGDHVRPTSHAGRIQEAGRPGHSGGRAESGDKIKERVECSSGRGRGWKESFIVAKRRGDAMPDRGDLNRKRQRTGNDFTGQWSFPGQKVLKTESKGAQNGHLLHRVDHVTVSRAFSWRVYRLPSPHGPSKTALSPHMPFRQRTASGTRKMLAPEKCWHPENSPWRARMLDLILLSSYRSCCFTSPPFVLSVDYIHAQVYSSSSLYSSSPTPPYSFSAIPNLSYPI